MINSEKDYHYYVKADRIAKNIPENTTLKEAVKALLLPDPIWAFQKALRKLEYYKNCKKGLLSTIYLFFVVKRYRRLSLKLGFTIPINVFGPGLSIAHYGTIVINDRTKVGANCRLHAGVNIGASLGSLKAPVLGDNCYIGPGAKLFGDIYLADGIAIGANAVVNKSFSEPHICIVGVPAKKVSQINTADFIIRATQILKEQNSAAPAGVG